MISNSRRFPQRRLYKAANLLGTSLERAEEAIASILLGCKMADAVGVVSEAVGFVMGITSLVANINDAIDTVRQNKEDCLDIKKRVQRINLTLSLLNCREELMKNQAISKATEALNETLAGARVLIAYCQERSAMCVYIQAGNISKKLSKMDQLISNANIDVAVAILASQRSELIAYPLRINPMVVSLSKGPEYVSPPPSSISNPSGRPIEVDDITQPSPAVQLRILLRETSNVAQQINEAVGTVRQNIEECTALGESVNSLSHVLEWALMEKVKDPAMSYAVEKLRQTFECANALIMECQKPKTTNLRRLIVGHSKPKRKLSKEICEVSDQMVLAIYNIISILLPYKNAPKALQLQQYPTMVDTLRGSSDPLPACLA
ncbi:unnamed protein product [Urochloa humidicola]